MFLHYITTLVYTIFSALIIITYLLKMMEQATIEAKDLRSETSQAILTEHNLISSRVISISDKTGLVGYITSPNYPQPYPINSSSYASLIILDNQAFDTIRVTFEDIELQTSNFCESEVIEISVYDRQSVESGTKLRRIIFAACGSILPRPIVVHDNNMLIHFFSDAFNLGNKRGFKIKYEFLNSEDQLYDACDLPDRFKCRNRNCIPIHLTCNRRDDCGDASDEDLLTPCQDLPTIPYSIDYTCGLLTGGGGVGNKYPTREFNVDEQSLLSNRIVGGTKALPSNGWPFQVSIQLKNVETVSHICGGTLIHPLFVLSAAHCFKGIIPTTDYKLIFGSTDLRVDAQPAPRNHVQIRYASTITLYPGGGLFRDLEEMGLRHVDMMNDLALIELNAPIKLSSRVWPACLPHLGETLEAGRVCMTSGFGDTRGTGHLFAQKQVRQEIIHRSACHSMNSDFDVDDYTMICVRNKLNSGPCRGDSGGPLVCVEGSNDLIDAEAAANKRIEEGSHSHSRPGDLIKYLPIIDGYSKEAKKDAQPTNKPSRFNVYGVTSFTTDGFIGGGFCGLDKVPTIYARVSTKVEWILSQMKMAMSRLGKEDNQQDQHNRSALFGYMFRSGLSRHENFTRPMTIYAPISTR